MKKIFHLAIIVSIGLFLNSCYYDSIYEPIDTGNGEDPIEVSYQNDIIPLWVQCVGCHNGNEPPNLEDDVSYDALLNGFVVPGDAESSILYQSLLGTNGVSLMPPGVPWPDSKINLVRDWINQGALNN
ncbi:MAG: hypothetical protein HKO67_10600 [Flavobacteriaceae bacterium]|nr:hypothetical protein [Flavobacteriaceae bacterium]